MMLLRSILSDQAFSAALHEEEDKGRRQLLVHLWVHQCNSHWRHRGGEPPCQCAATLQHQQGCPEHA